MELSITKGVEEVKKAIYWIMPILILIIMTILIYEGVIQLNRPSAQIFPVRGVDVSHYQGNVDWNQLQEQGIMFAYIKATEGSSYQDSAFQINWANVNLTEIRAGAYHFFSFESSGLNQARNFVNAVSVIDNMLPPVIDIEPYGQHKTLRNKTDIVCEIQDWLNAVEAAFGVKPVIYTTEAFYKDCIGSEFPDYDIWIRSVYKPPAESVQWTFWQYSSRVRLNGYDGEERFIDMNTFHGTTEEFEKYGR